MFRNNMFPVGYQPVAQPTYNAQETNQSSIVFAFVQGVEGAKAYYLSPNQKAILFDSDNDCFYIKTTDVYGMPAPLEAFNYTKQVEEPVLRKANVEYVTKDEVKSMIQEALNTEGSESNGESTV